MRMRTKQVLLFAILLLGLQGYSQKTLYWPTDFDNPASEFYQKISNTRRYESENFVLYWGDKVGNDPLNSLDASLTFNPRSIADTLEYSFKRYVTDLKFKRRHHKNTSIINIFNSDIYRRVNYNIFFFPCIQADCAD